MYPEHLKAQRKLWKAFQTNLHLAIYSNPHVSVIKVAIRDVDALNSNLDGPRVAKQNTQPPSALAKLERSVWREITIHVDGDMTWKQVISHVLVDSTFWQLELFSKGNRPFAVTPSSWQRDSVWTEGKGVTAAILGREIQVGVVGWLNLFGTTKVRNQRARLKGICRCWRTDNDKGTEGKPASTDFAAVDAAFQDGTFAKALGNGNELCIKRHMGSCNLQAWQCCGGSHACPQSSPVNGRTLWRWTPRVFCPDL